MTQPESFVWSPITDLPADWQHLQNPDVEALLSAWQTQAEDMQRRESYTNFLIKMRRQWAIETGILERLYSISEGATKTLIEKGLDAALISHEDTDKKPSDVIAMISDQHAAIEGLYQFIGGHRDFGKSYLKELHFVLTQHQPHYDAVDTLGQSVVRELPRGQWKKLKNNVQGPNGFVFEFCPPEHVEMELERLLNMHHKHEADHVPPDIEAAWLHHRFTLIHPFTDGNGRVARCLATLVFLKAKWFPLVVTRQDRTDYISGLRSADKGDLAPLIRLFGGIQSKAVKQALSLGEETLHEAEAVQAVLYAVKTKFQEWRTQEETQKKQVLTIGDTLQILARERLSETAREIDLAIRDEGEEFRAYMSHAPRGDSKSDYNYYQIIQCAKAQSYYANRQIYHAWAALTICTNIRTEILFAWHGIGRDSTGVLVCSALAYNRQSTETEQTLIEEVTPLSTEPFYLTYRENPTEVARRFRRWLDDRVLDGLAFWRKSVGA